MTREYRDVVVLTRDVDGVVHSQVQRTQPAGEAQEITMAMALREMRPGGSGYATRILFLIKKRRPPAHHLT